MVWGDFGVRGRRIGAYGICRDPARRVLLACGSVRSAFPGYWSLPGGTVEQGEAPGVTVVREFFEETGLVVESSGLRWALADVAVLPDGVLEHTDRLVYEVAVTGGALADEVGGTTERAAWFSAAELEELPVLPFTAAVLGAGVAGPAGAWVDGGGSGVPLPEVRAAEGVAASGPRSAPTRGQRFGAYALATDPGGRVLLTEIAPGYPGAGLWHLPGGGTDHGEAPERALIRELVEETGQVGVVTGLLGAAHRHDPAAVGPEGHPIDWHVVRVLFRVSVGVPTEPVVTEAAGGSTRRAGWFRVEELGKLPVTEAVTWALRWLANETDVH
jgi:ADP-ribose pyrophosphatase YjhB (NUDIX family)